jgi:hypothetical protein
VYGELMYLEWRYGVCSHRGSMRMVALGECEAVERALVIARSMARRMHSWSYSGLAMLVPCHVCGALLPVDEKKLKLKLFTTIPTNWTGCCLLGHSN